MISSSFFGRPLCLVSGWCLYGVRFFAPSPVVGAPARPRGVSLKFIGAALLHGHQVSASNAPLGGPTKQDTPLPLSLGWFSAEASTLTYGLWLLFHKTKRVYATNPSVFVSKGAHVFAKAYGKNFRESGQLPGEGPSPFNALTLFSVPRVQFLYSGLEAVLTAPRRLLETTWATTAGLASILEAGFFFPGAPLPARVGSRAIPRTSGNFSGLGPASSPHVGLNSLFSSALSGLRWNHSPRTPLRSAARFLSFRAQGGVGRSGLPDSRLAAIKGSSTRGYGDSYKLPTNVRAGYMRFFKQKSFYNLARLTRGALINHTGALPSRLLQRRRLTRATALTTQAALPQGFKAALSETRHRLRSTATTGLVSRPIRSSYAPGSGVGSFIYPTLSESPQLGSAQGGVFRQPIVRYKPGLSRYWRVHRFTLQRLFFMFAGGRQGRLTAAVSRVSRVASFSFFKAVELSLLHVIFCSGLGQQGEPTSMTRAGFFIAGGFAYLNGRRQWCPYTQLYQGDVLFVHPSSPRHAPTPQMRTRLGSYTPGASMPSDNPVYLEVDELTSSCVVLFEPQRWGLWGKQAARCFPHITLKLYNWKYST